MSKVFNLSYVLDEKCKKRIDLVSSNRLEELDDFIMSNFTTTDDVREKYKEVIDIFCQKNKDILEKAKKKGYRGYVVITYQDGDHVRRIPVMYKDGKKLKNIYECIEIFNENYNKKEIIREIRNKKYDVFTGEELTQLYFARYYLYYLQWTKKDEDDFNKFADMFYKRIIGNKKGKVKEDDLDLEKLYYHFRYMMDYFPFSTGKNKERVAVTGIKVDKLSEIEKAKVYHELYHGPSDIIKYSEIKTPDREGVEVIDSAPDDFKYAFYKALDTGDFDILYNMYSLEEIERYTNLLEGKRK